jgi:hypothetical protein
MSHTGEADFTGTHPDVPTSFITDSGTAIPVLNTLEILGGPGVTTSASGNIITISVAASGFTWNLVTSVSPPNPIQIIAENGYSCQGVSLVTFILPLVPTFGDTFIVASTTSRFQIAANASQQMRVGNTISTAGSGTVTSNSGGDMVEMVYMGSNIFQSMSPQGTLTLT